MYRSMELLMKSFTKNLFRFFGILGLLVFLWPSVSVTQNSSTEAETEDEVFIVCSRDKDIRWIRTFKTDSGTRCKSMYSKEGFAQTVSSGQNYMSCKSVLENIKKNIEEGGFKCKESQLLSFIEIN